MYATKRLEEPRDPGPSVRTSARPAFCHDPREAECWRKEFAERYVHISCVTTVRRRVSASEPPSRPFVVRASTSAGTMLHDCASFITRRVPTDLLSTLDERAWHLRRAMRGQVQDVLDQVVRGSTRSVIALCRTALRLVLLPSSRA
jgi:hypothetical protein